MCIIINLYDSVTLENKLMHHCVLWCIKNDMSKHTPKLKGVSVHQLWMILLVSMTYKCLSCCLQCIQTFCGLQTVFKT